MERIKYPEILAACISPDDESGSDLYIAHRALDLYSLVLQEYEDRYHPKASSKVTMEGG